MRDVGSELWAVREVKGMWYRFEKEDGSSPNGFLTDPISNYGYSLSDSYELETTDLPSPGANATWKVKIRGKDRRNK